MKTTKLDDWINCYEHDLGKNYGEHGRGWDKIVLDVLKRIKQYIKEENPFLDEYWYEEFEISQVKQKFGMLDIYVFPVNETIIRIIEEGRQEASYTCEHCGSSKGKRLSVSGWLVTLCDPCKFLFDTRRS